MSGILLAEHSPPTACMHPVSGTISLPSQGFFSPFPHGTSSLSVASEYLALGDGPPGFKQGFSCPALLRYPLRVRLAFAYVAITLFGWPFQAASTNQRIGNSTVADPTTPSTAREAPFRDHTHSQDAILSEAKDLLFPSASCARSAHAPRAAQGL